MFDDPVLTFYNNVVAAYDEYAAQRDSETAGRDRHLRTAVAAASVLYHFREHLPPSLRASVQNLKQTSSDYALMQGVTNASKHKQLTRGVPLVAGAEDIREVTVIVLYSDEQGDYSYAQTKIDVKCTDGITRWLDPAITRILNLWGNYLKDAGLCGYEARPEPQPLGNRYLSRREESYRLNLEAMAGLDFRQTMQLLRFDSALGLSVPVDLTRADFRFRIYKPPQRTVEVTMSHQKYGEISASMPLTEDESVTFQRINNQAERDRFMERFMLENRAEIEEKLRDKLIIRGTYSD
jgi:hypothetical protein